MPTNCDANLVGRSKAFINEMRELSAQKLQAVAISLEAALDTTTTSKKDTYKVPAGQDLAVFKVQGYVRRTAMRSESIVTLGGINLWWSELMQAKAENCLASLKNQDRKFEFFDGTSDLPLSSIMAPNGLPLLFDAVAPLMVSENETIESVFTLQDTNANIVGQSTRYGLILSGVLIAR